jgi:hypothetical protein
LEETSILTLPSPSQTLGAFWVFLPHSSPSVSTFSALADIAGVTQNTQQIFGGHYGVLD